MGDGFLHSPCFWTAAGFLVALVVGLAVESRRMPREKKLELNVLRAARALSKLSRARRVLNRYSTVRRAAPGGPMPKMVQRLWKASSDAAYAKNHLSAVLKKVANLGCPIDVMRNIDRYIAIAESTRQECRRVVRAQPDMYAPAFSHTPAQMLAWVQECAETLEQAKTAVAAWQVETEQAAQTLGANVDPVIWRSGGILRNPFKAGDLAEAGQSESVLNFRLTLMDTHRTVQCIVALQLALDALQSPTQYGELATNQLVSEALDSIDAVLGDAELPLPESLAQVETPFDSPGSIEPRGTLLQLYACLTMIEAALASA